METQLEKRLQEILSDNLSGSRDIAGDIAALFDAAIENKRGAFEDLAGWLRGACEELKAVHCSMRVVEGICNGVVGILDAGMKEASTRPQLIDFLDSWGAERFKLVQSRIADHAFNRVKGLETIISHSLSSTVLAVFRRLVERNQRPKIIQSISAPANEGLKMARLISDSGLEVELIADAGLAVAVQRADAVLVGADAVGLDGLVNKLGSLGLALAAFYCSKPVFAVFDMNKLLPPDSEVEIERRDPGELARLESDAIEVVNVYFDLTPLDLLLRLITEEGAFTAEQIREMIRSKS